MTQGRWLGRVWGTRRKGSPGCPHSFEHREMVCSTRSRDSNRRKKMPSGRGDYKSRRFWKDPQVGRSSRHLEKGIWSQKTDTGFGTVVKRCWMWLSWVGKAVRKNTNHRKSTQGGLSGIECNHERSTWESSPGDRGGSELTSLTLKDTFPLGAVMAQRE